MIRVNLDRETASPNYCRLSILHRDSLFDSSISKTNLIPAELRELLDYSKQWRRAILPSSRYVDQTSTQFISKLTEKKLEDPSLFKQDSFVNGEWVGSASGKRFAVLGKASQSGCGC